MRFNPTHGARSGFHAAKNRSTHGNAAQLGWSIMTTPGTVSDLRNIVLAGERIYAEKYKQRFEETYADQFAAIDINSGSAFVARFPEQAIDKALAQLPGAVIHVVRIGAPSAYQVSFVLGIGDADLARIV